MSTSRPWLSACLAVVGLVASADGAVTIETVPVGDPGNAGEISGVGAGGEGPDRICGSVAYAYNIGKYEVTAGQYTEFLNAVAAVDTYGLYNWTMSDTTYGGCGIVCSGRPGSYTYSVAAAYANRPVNFVGYWDACRFANWLHNGQPVGAQGSGTTETGAYTLNDYTGPDGRTIQRNPDWRWAVTSEDEWYKAAYYNPATSSYYRYPTGSDVAPGRDMADVSGNNANCDYGSGPYPIDSPYYTTVAGEFQNSESAYGTFDQGGNVWECNEAIVSQDATYARRGGRGGSFTTVEDRLLRASYRGGSVPTTFSHFSMGFRVSNAPERADTDGDGVWDGEDNCPGTVPGAPVDADGCPPIIIGDFDRDGDVDNADLQALVACFSGPAIDMGLACADKDLDHDGDVDQSDFGIFQRCYSGVGVPADPNCQ